VALLFFVIKQSAYTTPYMCFGTEVCKIGVQESTPEVVSVFQQETEKDQEWIFLIRTGFRAGVVFCRVFLRFIRIFAVYINYYTGVKQEQESIIFV